MSPPSGPGLLRQLSALRAEWLGLLHDVLHLAELETRRNGQYLFRILVLALAAALLLVSAWLTLLAGVALGAIQAGMPPFLAVLLVVAANLLLALGCVRHSAELAGGIGWAATRRALAPRPAPPGTVIPVSAVEQPHDGD